MVAVKEKRVSEVNKAFRAYIQRIERKRNLKIAKRNLTYEDFFKNKMLIVHAIRDGIPYSLFKHIKEITPFTEKDWASFLNLSTKSLQRYKNEENHLFKSVHTEKIIALAEVTNLGKEVFDSFGQFYLWLNTPLFALGDMKPIELLKDSYGKEMVVNELNRIDQGIFV